MKRIEDIGNLTYYRRQGGQFRWITVSTLLLAIGCILHLVSPSVAGFTPNWTIATYCVAVSLTRPTYKQALGIGLVAALINVLTSKSGFPYGNLLSEPAGALLSAVIVRTLPRLHIGRYELNPSINGMAATCLSGGIFVTVLKIVMELPDPVYFGVMLPAVAIIGAINAVITPLLYFPAYHLFLRRGLIEEMRRGEEESDHSQYILEQKQEGVVSLESFSYWYPKQTKPALEQINLAIKKGDFTVITGSSGSGKSTLCLAVTGAIPHYYGGTMHGMAFVGGKAVTQHSIADLACSVGAMLADYDSQIVTMTVEEEIAFSLENRGFAKDEIVRRTKEALHKVGLDGLEDRPVRKMSGGQRQRLVIASVLATEPEILVFDEPTSSLDPEGCADFYKLISHLNKEYGHTILVVEHILSAALPYANRLILMENGKIACDSTPAGTLRYMYSHGIYLSAIPELFRCQLDLEAAGYTPAEPWISAEQAAKEFAGQLTKGGC